MMASFGASRMARLAQRVAAIPGVQSELLPSRFVDGEMQLAVVCGSAGVRLSVLTDADMPALFELVRFGPRRDELFDKLSESAVLERISSIAQE